MIYLTLPFWVWLIGLIVFLIATYKKPPAPEIAKVAFAAYVIGLAIWVWQSAEVKF